MAGLEDMLKGVGSERNMVAISGEERETISEMMQHILDLKAGDRVQWKRGMRDKRNPSYDAVVEVFRIFPTYKTHFEGGTNHDCDENDFSILYRDSSGEIQEFAYDSRRFERVQQ